MNIIETLGTRPEVTALGWTLLHFLWQGALIAIVVAVPLAALRRASAHARYLVTAIGMLMMLMAPVITFPIMLVLTYRGQLESIDAGLASLKSLTFAARLAPLLPTLTFVWIAGTSMLQGRLAFLWMRARHLRKYGVSDLPASWQGVVSELCAELGIGHAVKVFESSLATVPMVIGWLQPTILVPTAALLNLEPAQLRAILAHELAHVRRHDFLINLLQALVECLLFYHPAVWWLSGRMRNEREYCCDDMAVGVCGDAVGLARGLASLDVLRNDWLSPTVALNGGSLMNRICRLVGVCPRPNRRISGRLLLAAGSTAAMTVLAFSMAASASVATEERVEERPVRSSIQEIELAPILEELDIEEVALLEPLIEVGVDNETILEMLPWFGIEPTVVEAVERQAALRAATLSRLTATELRLSRAMEESRLRREAPEHLRGILLDGSLHHLKRQAIDDGRAVRLRQMPGDENGTELLLRRLEAKTGYLDQVNDKLTARVGELKVRMAAEPTLELQASVEALLGKLEYVELEHEMLNQKRHYLLERIESGASKGAVTELLGHLERRAPQLHRAPEDASLTELKLRELHESADSLERERGVILERIELDDANDGETYVQLRRLDRELAKLHRVQRDVRRNVERKARREFVEAKEHAGRRRTRKPHKEDVHGQLVILSELDSARVRLQAAFESGDIDKDQAEAKLHHLELIAEKLESRLRRAEPH